MKIEVSVTTAVEEEFGAKLLHCHHVHSYSLAQRDRTGQKQDRRRGKLKMLGKLEKVGDGATQEPGIE